MNNALTAAVHTLGCKVNQCDAEALIARLTEAGIAVRPFDQAADIYVINTCTVTHTGDKKSLQMVRRARRLNPSAFVAVCGCMPRSQADSMDKIKLAGADFVFDTRKPEELLIKLEEILADKAYSRAAIQANDTTSERTRAFIKIQDGCDRFCAYCIVPYVRGPITSRPPSDILSEAAEHIRRGAQEIVLTGIQVAAYGYDTGGTTLPVLIKQLASQGPKRLRLSSIDPWAVDDEFLAVVAESPTLCSHFHLSLQSGCDRTLARMNRRCTTAEYANAAEKLKAIRPNLALTTDIIVGFPGETDDDFKESLHFAKEMGFSQIHVFEYSPRAGTPAASFPDQVPSQVKTARGAEMRTLAQSLKQQFLCTQIGRVVPVLFETASREPSTWQGHTDNYCMVKASGANLANTLMDVLITDITDDGLIGKPIVN